jgi:hypothetical protein
MYSVERAAAEMNSKNKELAVLADFICDFNLDAIPADVLSAARYCVLDSVGSALGAATFEEIPGIAEELFSMERKRKRKRKRNESLSVGAKEKNERFFCSYDQWNYGTRP